MVTVPTVTESAFATADIFFFSCMPIASITCMSFTEISLYSEVISAFSSIPMISLNSFTSTSFTVSYEFVINASPSFFICFYYTPKYFEIQSIFFNKFFQ